MSFLKQSTGREFYQQGNRNGHFSPISYCAVQLCQSRRKTKLVNFSFYSAVKKTNIEKSSFLAGNSEMLAGYINNIVLRSQVNSLTDGSHPLDLLSESVSEKEERDHYIDN